MLPKAVITYREIGKRLAMPGGSRQGDPGDVRVRSSPIAGSRTTPVTRSTSAILFLLDRCAFLSRRAATLEFRSTLSGGESRRAYPVCRRRVAASLTASDSFVALVEA